MPEAEGVVFFQTGAMILSLFPRLQLARDAFGDAYNEAGVSAQGQRFAGEVALAFNTRTRDEVDSVLAESIARGRNPPQTRAAGILGRLFRMFRGPRWLCVGGRLEPGLRNRRRWQHSPSRLTSADLSEDLVEVETYFDIHFHGDRLAVLRARFKSPLADGFNCLLVQPHAE